MDRLQATEEPARVAETSVREFRADLRALEREVQLSLASETGCCGVTMAQCHLLLEVERRGNTSVTELAGVLELDKSTLSRSVDGLCQVGFLDRRTDPDSRRQQVISLTAAGRKKADSINGLCDDFYSRLLKRIPAANRRAVMELVPVLVKAMRDTRKGSPAALRQPSSCQ